VSDRERKTPDAGAAGKIVNEMRNRGILMSKIGEHDNVLKLRPPLCFATEHADMLIAELDDVLGQYRTHAND